MLRPCGTFGCVVSVAHFGGCRGAGQVGQGVREDASPGPSVEMRTDVEAVWHLRLCSECCPLRGMSGGSVRNHVARFVVARASKS